MSKFWRYVLWLAVAVVVDSFRLYLLHAPVKLWSWDGALFMAVFMCGCMAGRWWEE